MVSTKDKDPYQNITMNIEQNNSYMLEDNTSEKNQQNNRNIHKRIKESDDSFECEHRDSSDYQMRAKNITTQYFNNSTHRNTTANTILHMPQISNEVLPRSTFPPFRLSFNDSKLPSELSIIKDINRQCRISLSFGRYSSFGKKNSFLIYANSADQYDRLMTKSIWPTMICDRNYVLDLPSKIPTSYSIVMLNVPVQWNIEELGNDIKNQYSTIVKVERFYVKGGKPISKVRINFSSSEELKSILKNKSILLDDANTSYKIEPYIPPTKILRCYNCQQYNDHTAINCPNKDKPICFRCGLNHPYNSNCQNKICCAHCRQEHMAGNPSCPNKIEERNKRNEELKSKNVHTQHQQQQKSLPSVWTEKSYEHLTSIYSPNTGMINANENVNMITIADISNKLDVLMTKVDELSIKQLKTNKIVEKLHCTIYSCRQEIDQIRDFVFDTISPYLRELGDSFLIKCKTAEKDRLRTIHTSFKEKLEDHNKTIIVAAQSNTASNTTLNEHNC
ncbi:unnamed protein product [Rotaria magnacalcarata]|uniref:Uncharacterized protein n=4 Tax=Rotaria magnacalcarata TaxID=392030 RepID=A0A816NIV3_9BILA|nr:unnamed protein product [Rotaria magnacalcarata]CAF3858457.1 unnamed protein product [Rotaria magnacalcarata]CAF4050845.1 unnamed protein product [Rotaria magnacalcarata]